MSDLRVTAGPEALREIAKTIGQLKNDSEETASKLANQANVIQQGWQGEASRNYADKYNELHNRLSQAVASVEEIRQAMNKSADSFDQGEEDIKGILND